MQPHLLKMDLTESFIIHYRYNTHDAHVLTLKFFLAKLLHGMVVNLLKLAVGALFHSLANS